MKQKLSLQIGLALLATASCNAISPITVAAIENYFNQPQPYSYINYKSFESLIKHTNLLFTAEQFALDPTCAQLYFDLGESLYYAKKYPEALCAYNKTIQHKNDHARAYTQIGKIMMNTNQQNDAIEPFRTALLLEPKNIEARLLLGYLYNEKHLFNQTIDLISEGLKLEPGNIKLTFELANNYHLANRLDEAIAIYQTLDRHLPDNPSILYNMAFTLQKLGDMEKALDCYTRILELQPNNIEALFCQGLTFLSLGNFEKGWDGYEWRNGQPRQELLRTYPKPRWDGSDLEGKTILIHAEQGLGDTLQFIRYAKLIKEKNGIIIAAVQKSLVPLMERCKHIDKVISLEDETPSHFDVHSPMLSLPYILKTRIDTIPCEIPYLYADTELTAGWKQKLATDKNFKIGICWQGNDSYETIMARETVIQKSIPLKAFESISKVPGVTLYSLQKMSGTDQLRDLPNGMTVMIFEGDFDQSNGRFMDTAAVIKNLDLVITIDTSIGHLASGLGVPTWIMLPNYADWRWIINRNDSPWYPNVTRLFKQPTPGDWESIIQDVATELKKHLSKK